MQYSTSGPASESVQSTSSTGQSTTAQSCGSPSPEQQALCHRGTLDLLRAEFQRYPADVQQAALAATGLRLDDRASAADFGELLAAAQHEVGAREDIAASTAQEAARYTAAVTEVLLTMDAEIALMEQRADELDLEAAALVERGDDYATDVCADAWSCTGGGMVAASTRADAAGLRAEAEELRQQAAELQQERDALDAAVFGSGGAQ